MVTSRTALGLAGEERAVRHLESLGYEIVERNYHCRYGEIDVIARDGGDLVFVEVKSRRSKDFGWGSEAVDNRKQRKMIRSARAYMIARNLGEVDARYDVVEVYFEDGRPVTVEVIRGAFWEER